MIRKVRGKNKYILYSRTSHRRLSKPLSYSAVVKREGQINYFKHMKGGKK